MTTPIFIAPCGWDGLGVSQRQAIERLATDDSVWVAPTEGTQPSGFRYEPLTAATSRALGTLSDIDSPVLVAAHPSRSLWQSVAGTPSR